MTIKQRLRRLEDATICPTCKRPLATSEPPAPGNVLRRVQELRLAIEELDALEKGTADSPDHQNEENQ